MNKMEPSARSTPKVLSNATAHKKLESTAKTEPHRLDRKSGGVTDFASLMTTQPGILEHKGLDKPLGADNMNDIKGSDSKDSIGKIQDQNSESKSWQEKIKENADDQLTVFPLAQVDLKSKHATSALVPTSGLLPPVRSETTSVTDLNDNAYGAGLDSKQKLSIPAEVSSLAIILQKGGHSFNSDANASIITGTLLGATPKHAGFIDTQSALPAGQNLQIDLLAEPEPLHLNPKTAASDIGEASHLEASKPQGVYNPVSSSVNGIPAQALSAEVDLNSKTSTTLNYAEKFSASQTVAQDSTRQMQVQLGSVAQPASATVLPPAGDLKEGFVKTKADSTHLDVRSLRQTSIANPAGDMSKQPLNNATIGIDHARLFFGSVEMQEGFSWEAARLSPSNTTMLPPSKADIAPHIARQLVEVMAQAAHRPTEIALSPQELGRVRMSVKTEDGMITVSIIAERADTLDLMRRHIDQLGQSFRAMGYESISFAFGQSGHSGDQGNNESGGWRHGDHTDATATEQNDTNLIQLDGARNEGVDIRL